MAEIAWHLLQPVDTGALTMQGFQTGMALVGQVQSKNALRSYLANPDDPEAYNALAYYDPSAAATIQTQRLHQRKVMLDQQDRQRAVALGQLYNADPKGAREEAIGAGDFDLAKTFGDLDDAKQKQSRDFWDKAGAVAFRIRTLDTPEKRAAYWAEARPILEAQGAPADMLDKFDPNNAAQVDAAIATAQKVTDLYQQTKPEEFNVDPGAGRYSRDPITNKITTIIAPNPGDRQFGAPAVVGQGASGDQAFDALVQQESGGRPGVHGQPTQYGTAVGSTQMLPETAQAMATKLGLPWRPELMEGTSPEAADYQLKLGRAYFDEGLQKYGGDPRKAAMYYHGGPDESKWGPKTRRHADLVMERLGHKPAEHGASDIRAAAQRAIANGADPEAVRARALAQGVTL